MSLTEYDPYTVPPAPDGTRFALGTLPKGWPASRPGEVIANVYQALLEDRVRDSRAFAPETVEVALKAVVRDREGTYTLVSRGTASDRPHFTPGRPSKLWKQEKDGRLLDSLFLGEEDGAFGKAPDSEVWDALLATAQHYNIDGRDLRNLNDAVARLIALRVGLDVHPANLPNIGTE